MSSLIRSGVTDLGKTMSPRYSLACMSREFADLWARHEVADPEPRTLTYLHPQAGTLRFAVSELDVPDLPEARIVVYTPRDDETRAKLPLTRRPPARGHVIGEPGPPVFG
jgi:hypothetical protein